MHTLLSIGDRFATVVANSIASENLARVSSMVTHGADSTQRIASLGLLVTVLAIFWVSRRLVVQSCGGQPLISDIDSAKVFQRSSGSNTGTMVLKVYRHRFEVLHLQWTTHTLYSSASPKVWLSSPSQSE